MKVFVFMILALASGYARSHGDGTAPVSQPVTPVHRNRAKMYNYDKSQEDPRTDIEQEEYREDNDEDLQRKAFIPDVFKAVTKAINPMNIIKETVLPVIRSLAESTLKNAANELNSSNRVSRIIVMIVELGKFITESIDFISKRWGNIFTPFNSVFKTLLG